MIMGLRPTHVESTLTPYWTTTVPDKQVVDSLAYNFNVGAITEDFTSRRDMKRLALCNILCNPATLLSYASTAVSDADYLIDKTKEASGINETEKLRAATVLAGSAITLVQETTATAYHDAFQNAETIVESGTPLFSMGNTTPFIQMSFDPRSQGGRLPRFGTSRPLHNFIVFDETDARRLMNGNDNADLEITLRDVSDPGRRNLIFDPGREFTNAQQLTTRPDTDYNSLVMAHAFTLGINQRGSSPTKGHVVLDETAAFFMGHGISGAGIAVVVHAKEDTLITNHHVESVTGLQQTEAATIDITVYSFGGTNTYDSNCWNVPLYGYVAPYFRCIGYEKTGIVTGLTTQSQPTTCYGPAQTYIAQMQANATRLALRSPDDVFYILDPSTRIIQEGLGSPPSPNATAEEQLIRTTQYADDAVILTRSISNNTRDLVSCLQSTGTITPIWPTVTIPESAYNAARDALTAASTAQLANTRTAMQTQTTALGATTDLARLLQTTVMENSPVRITNALPAIGNYDTNYILADAMSRVKTGQLTLDVLKPDGTKESSTLGIYPPPLGDPLNVSTTALPSARRYATAVWTGEKVLIFGGTTGFGFISQTLNYDPVTGNVTIHNDTTGFARADQSAVWTGTFAFIFGGTGGQYVLRYNPATQQLVGILTEPSLGNGTGAVWNGTHAFIFGGRTGSGQGARDLNVVRRYDPATNNLTNMTATLPTGRWASKAIWNGTHAFIFGGNNLTSGTLDTILRYDPTSDTMEELALHLPVSLHSTTAIWDGKDAYLFGGQPLTDAVYKFNPANQTIERVYTDLPNARAAMTGIWTGQDMILVGGDNGTTTLDQIIHYNVSKATNQPSLKIGINGDHKTIPLTETHEYFLNLSATDNHGNMVKDAVHFKSDIHAPTILTNLLSTVYTNVNNLPVSWTVQDSVSGMKNASIQKWDQAASKWVNIANFTGSNFSGNTSLQYLNTTINLTALETGESVQLRVNASDRAGNNETNATRTVIVDRLPPDITGLFTNAVNGFVNTTFLNSTSQAWDNTSGLASIRIWLANATGETDITPTTQLNGISTYGPVGDSRFAWIDTIYKLNVTVEDRAGNARTATLAVADVQLNARITPLIPEFIIQDLADEVLISGNVIIPTHYGAATDYTLIKVLRRIAGSNENDTNLANFTLMQENNLTAALNNMTTYWNATNTTAWPIGSYRVTFEAHKGKTVTYLNSTTNVTLRFNNATNLTQWRTYGTLNGTSDYDLHRINPAGGSWFRITVVSRNGTDVDFYLHNGTDPSVIGNTPDSYSVQRNGTNTTESYQWNNTQPGEVFSLLVTHKNATNTGYSITYERETQQGPPPPPSEECSEPTEVGGAIQVQPVDTCSFEHDDV